MDRLKKESLAAGQGKHESAGTDPVRRVNQPDPIADGLRKLWENVEKEPVPNEFLDILDRIDAASAKERGS